MDIHTKHPLIYRHRNSRTFRNDSLVRTIAQHLSEAARASIVEPRDIDSGHHSKTEIKTTASDGRRTYLYITVVHPFTASHLPTTEPTASSCFHTAFLVM